REARETAEVAARAKLGFSIVEDGTAIGSPPEAGSGCARREGRSDDAAGDREQDRSPSDLTNEKCRRPSLKDFGEGRCGRGIRAPNHLAVVKPVRRLAVGSKLRSHARAHELGERAALIVRKRGVERGGP